LLRDTKRKVYTEYLRSISAGYAVAKSRSKSPSEEAEAELRSASASEEGKLRAATAGIVLLSGKEISDPAKELTDTVVPLHGEIAAGMPETEENLQVAAVDGDRLILIDKFKKDLQIGQPSGGSTPPTARPSRPAARRSVAS
jgi:hypothetical protein